jgi:hypothetical protein
LHFGVKHFVFTACKIVLARHQSSIYFRNVMPTQVFIPVAITPAEQALEKSLLEAAARGDALLARLEFERLLRLRTRRPEPLRRGR